MSLLFAESASHTGYGGHFASLSPFFCVCVAPFSKRSVEPMLSTRDGDDNDDALLHKDKDLCTSRLSSSSSSSSS